MAYATAEIGVAFFASVATILVLSPPCQVPSFINCIFRSCPVQCWKYTLSIPYPPCAKEYAAIAIPDPLNAPVRERYVFTGPWLDLSLIQQVSVLPYMPERHKIQWTYLFFDASPTPSPTPRPTARRINNTSSKSAKSTGMPHIRLLGWLLPG
jgi:hypothetical protein